MSQRPLFSVCIPAYDRPEFLEPLLQSVFAQDFSDFEIVICEDGSRQRRQIGEIVTVVAKRHPGAISYYENETNLGYDHNIRNLVAKSTGRFCFFMGNDDLMCPGALSEVAGLLARHENVGVVLKSYAWFDGAPEHVSQVVRYFSTEREFMPGKEAVRACFRRSGVISGYIVERDAAHAAATDKFDGSLYYQMRLTSQVLLNKTAVFTPKILVLCRNGEPPQFGSSAPERGKYIPGRYTPQARLNMVRGALSILEDLKVTNGLDLLEDVKRDYANYFYAYIRDQLDVPLREYWKLYRAFGAMGFDQYPMFHAYFATAYILGERRFDAVVRLLRKVLGRSPQFGSVGAGVED